jgi:hypothetical protein
LGIIVQIARDGTIPPARGGVAGAAVAMARVMVSGVRGSAWTAVVKGHHHPRGRAFLWHLFYRFTIAAALARCLPQ